ncbi:hypothetical protein ACX6XY_07505 [Streptomyces sp. O3]
MKRPLLAAVAAAAALFAITGCGTESGADRAAAPPDATGPGTAGPDATPSPDFQDVAARCADSAPSPSPTRSAIRETLDPWASKHVENNAFKQAMPLGPDARCRGRAHAERITKALSAGPGVRDEQGLRAALEKLSYPKDSTEVSSYGTTLGFTLSIPETGPCLTGKVRPTLEVTPHGPYMEGGCTKPRGGH